MYNMGKDLNRLISQSTQNGATMTELSLKMQRDSRSMRILTSVALVYLPISLIAVRPHSKPSLGHRARFLRSFVAVEAQPIQFLQSLTSSLGNLQLQLSPDLHGRDGICTTKALHNRTTDMGIPLSIKLSHCDNIAWCFGLVEMDCEAGLRSKCLQSRDIIKFRSR